MNPMNELTEKEMVQVTGGEVSSDVLYGAGITVSVLVLGTLFTLATGGAGAPVAAVWALGILGTTANATAIAAAQ
jgi:hypothetical protein